jgi:hypothetical protein
MPNNGLDGKTVVASCWYRDLGPSDQQYKNPNDDWPDQVYLVLLLNGEAPFFMVAYVCDHEAGEWEILESHTTENIVTAVEVYQDWGGDI